MKKLRTFPTVLLAALLLTAQVMAAPAAELVRVFETGGVLYTYVSLPGSDRPITKSEAKLGRQSFPAAGTLETVRQAGFPVEYLLLVDNFNSMPPFREEVSAFAAALTEVGGTHTSYALATFGDQFVLRGESLTAETLAAGAASLSMDETVTRLNTSIAQALDHFEALPRTGNQLRCLVILSDGVQYDPQGGVPYDELVERLDRSDVMLYSVGLGGDSDALERMGALALTSWGLHWAVSDAQEAAQAADSLTRENGDLLVTSFDITAYRPAQGAGASRRTGSRRVVQHLSAAGDPGGDRCPRQSGAGSDRRIYAGKQPGLRCHAGGRGGELAAPRRFEGRRALVRPRVRPRGGQRRAA